MPVDPDGGRFKSPEPQHVGNSLFILLFLLIFINFLLMPVVIGPTSESTQPYSHFIDQVEQGQVAYVLIKSDRITYTLKGKEQVLQTVPVPMDLQLTERLRKNKVEFAAAEADRPEWPISVLGWVLPFILFLGFWWWFLASGGQQGAQALKLGRSKARIYSEGSIGVNFKDVAGIDEAKAELLEIVDFLKNPERYTRIGGKIPKGILLVGPPGTGKTLLAKAIAGESGVPFFSISGSEFVELFVGVGASRVRDLFEQAKQKAPCIVFIDELDAVGKSRVGAHVMGNDEREQTLNQLLAEMDGFAPNTGVILLAATNRPESLDPALLRPGRFDRRVLVDRPDKIGREAILRVHARQVQLALDVDLTALAARTPGFVGADLANLVNEATLLAARQDKKLVSMADFAEAIERLIAGLEKRSRILSDHEKQTIAYHEVGHGIVAQLMPSTGHVEKISIIPRGIAALGYTLQLPEEEHFLMTETEIRERLAVLLGGRSAEEMIFSQVSTGAADDLQKATDLAERMITLYGMSETLGAVVFERITSEFLGGAPTPRRPLSDDIARQIDNEIHALIEAAHELALNILRMNLPLVEEMAQVLVHQEVLEGEQLLNFLAKAIQPGLHRSDLVRLPLEPLDPYCAATVSE
jgi:cell division protease FtsH